MHSVTSYGCAQNLNGGHAACPNQMRLPRRKAEKNLLNVLKQELLTPEACEIFMVEVKKQLSSYATTEQTNTKQLQLEVDNTQRVINNIMNAIKAGILSASTKNALEDAEVQKASAEKRLRVALDLDHRSINRMAELLPEALGRYRKTIENIGTALETKMEHARGILKDLLGDVLLHKQKHGLEAVVNVDWTKTLSGSSDMEKLKVLMVARAGFEPATFGL